MLGLGEWEVIKLLLGYWLVGISVCSGDSVGLDVDLGVSGEFVV